MSSRLIQRANIWDDPEKRAMSCKFQYLRCRAAVSQAELCYSTEASTTYGEDGGAGATSVVAQDGLS